MKRQLKRIASIALATLSLCSGVTSVADDSGGSWTTPVAAHRVIANLYAVGSVELAVYLVTSDDGHILINTGLEDSLPLISENIRAVGFRIEDVRILLTNQAHFDHVSAMAEIRELTGARMWATEADARLLEDGGNSDPLFGGRESFRPVKVDVIIEDGDVIELGETILTVHAHPGHTPGSVSYSMHVLEDDRQYNVLIANMGSINPGTRFLADPTYPGIADDYARTFSRQRALDVDIWVAAHGSQYGLHDKFKAGQPYDPDTFADPEGFFDLVDRLEKTYREWLARER